MQTTYEVFVSYRNRDRGSMPSRRLVIRQSQKRTAIRTANRQAQTRHRDRDCYPRQVSVYAVPPGKKRGTLVHQVHFNSKLGRLIKEEL